MTAAATGRIDALFRYPVKSMQGEAIDASAVTEPGLAGDRAYALIDAETGKVASAKNPRRWGVLFECRARFVDDPGDGSALPPIEITGPDGDTVGSDDPDVHEWLSRVVGRPVRLETTPPERPIIEQYRPRIDGVADPQAETTTDDVIAVVVPGTFFDAAPLHVVTTATLERLHDLAPGSRFPAQRFRPNVVIAVDDARGFVENGWVDHSLALGADVTASVFLAAPRCVMTTLPQAGLPRDKAVLQTIAVHNRFDIPGLGQSSCVGVYALVSNAGRALVGDRIAVS